MRERAFLIEGPNAVLEALDAGFAVEDVFVTDDAPERELLVDRAGDRLVAVGDKVLRAMSDTDSPQGVVAIAERPQKGMGHLPSPASLVLVLASIRDPGNAGTLLRSATAAGAEAVVFAGECVDPYGPKTVRASAGAAARLTIIEEGSLDVVVDGLREAGLTVLASGTAGRAAYDLDLMAPVAFVLGNEAWGLAPGAEALTDGLVAIPMPGPVESLNVGIAGSLLLFEAVRQRRD